MNVFITKLLIISKTLLHIATFESLYLINRPTIGIMRKHLEFYLDNASIENALELLEMSEACTWLIDRNYTLLAFNKIYAAHMYAYVSKHPVVGQKDLILDCFPQDFAHNINEYYAKAFAGEVVKAIEKGFKSDGSPADIIMIFKPVKDNDGEVIGVCCSRNDISEYVLLKEQLEEKSKTLDEISWQQSHMFRGPLSTAKGIVLLLQDIHSLNKANAPEYHELVLGLNSKLEELDRVIHEIVEKADIPITIPQSKL